MKINSFSSLLFLLVYTFFFASVNLMPHTHISNGVTIVHSHLSKDTFSSNKAQTSSHSHSSGEINFFNQFSNLLFFCSFGLLVLASILRLQFTRIFFNYVSELFSNNKSVSTLRGPPYLLV